MEREITIFDQILAKKIPVDIVHEDESILAFRDNNAQAPVHVLVIPKKKIARFANFDQWNDQDVGVFFKRVAHVAEVLGLTDSGYRIVINNGRDAQQSVEYLHAHILGGRPMTWPPG